MFVLVIGVFTGHSTWIILKYAFGPLRFKRHGSEGEKKKPRGAFAYVRECVCVFMRGFLW